MARRLGSAMISKTDPTLFIYSSGHIRVKVCSAAIRPLRASASAQIFGRMGGRLDLLPTPAERSVELHETLILAAAGLRERQFRGK